MTTVRVEARHMDGALRKDVCHCPVAKALQEMVDPKFRVEVNNKSVEFAEVARPFLVGVFVDLPAEAREFIRDWDNGWHPDPPKFDLDIPDHFLRAEQ